MKVNRCCSQAFSEVHRNLLAIGSTCSCELRASRNVVGNQGVRTVSLLATFKTVESEKEYRQLNLHYGQRVLVKTSLNYVDKFRNPGISTLTEYLERKGYDATGIVKEPESIATIGETRIF
jgi:predicted membrane metal-binding protein